MSIGNNPTEYQIMGQWLAGGRRPGSFVSSQPRAGGGPASAGTTTTTGAAPGPRIFVGGSQGGGGSGGFQQPQFSQQGGRLASSGGGGMGGGGSRSKKNSKTGANSQQNLFKKLLAELTGGTEDANTAANQQYQDLLASVAQTVSGVTGPGGTFDRAEQFAGNIGQGARRRVTRQGKQAKAASRQDLISRGLGNTTVVDAVERGIGTDVEDAMQMLDEQDASRALGLLTQRAGAQMDLGGLEADAILSRRIQQPDTNAILSLMSNLGQFGG